MEDIGDNNAENDDPRRWSFSTTESTQGLLRTQLSEDAELRGLSLYEKKAVLVNRELDSHGMGRYQWYIWLLCGFGYFVDLLWAQAFGLALVAIIPEFGLVGPKASRSGDLSTAFNAGLTAGAFIWGMLVDVIGRRWAFNGTILIASIFGISLGTSNDYSTLLVLTALCGFGVGGNIPIDTTICLEFLPQNRRFLLAALSLFQPAGIIVGSALAYGLIPAHSCEAKIECGTQPAGEACCTRDSNSGWRHFLFSLGAITLSIFLIRFFLFNFSESPKYLLSRGHDARAAKALEQVAAFNRRQPMITLQHFKALDGEHTKTNHGSMEQLEIEYPTDVKSKQKPGILRQIEHEGKRIAQLFPNWPTTYLTIMTWLIYIFDYVSFTASGACIPTLLSIKGEQVGVTTNETYRNFIFMYCPSIVAALVAAAVYEIPGLGRRWGMAISGTIQGASLFLFATARTEAAYIGFNVLEYFMQTVFNAILYAWTPEIFPAPIRGTASGVASFLGRLFGIVAPVISARIWASYGSDTSNPQYGNGVLYFAGASIWVGVLCVFLLPSKEIGRQSF